VNGPQTDVNLNAPGATAHLAQQCCFYSCLALPCLALPCKWPEPTGHSPRRVERMPPFQGFPDAEPNRYQVLAHLTYRTRPLRDPELDTPHTCHSECSGNLPNANSRKALNIAAKTMLRQVRASATLHNCSISTLSPTIPFHERNHPPVRSDGSSSAIDRALAARVSLR